MLKTLIATAATLGLASAAAAADLPRPQPVAPAPAVGVGKAPIGKLPIIGKLPGKQAVPQPAVAPVITKG